MDRLTGPEGLAIQKFEASARETSPGTQITLSWDVAGATSVVIDQGVGQVAAKGSKQVRPDATITYTLKAQAEAASASASVLITVRGSAPPPSPGPSPTPSASPSPSPSPSPTPTPSPTPSPSPAPTPSPSPGTASCGRLAKPPNNCALTVIKQAGVVGTGCIELVGVAFDGDCPATFNAERSLRFDIEARLGAKELSWRRAGSSSDVLLPAYGTLQDQAVNRVNVRDIAIDDVLTIEVLDGGALVMSFSLRHR